MQQSWSVSETRNWNGTKFLEEPNGCRPEQKKPHAPNPSISAKSEQASPTVWPNWYIIGLSNRQSAGSGNSDFRPIILVLQETRFGHSLQTGSFGMQPFRIPNNEFTWLELISHEL
jgi:hypothetical protein